CARPAAGSAINSAPTATMIALRMATLRSPRPAIGGGHAIEACSLLVLERIIEFLERPAHGLDCIEHGRKAPLDRLEPGRHRQRSLFRARRLDAVGSPERGLAQLLEARALGLGRTHVPLDVVDRELRHRIAALAADSRRTGRLAMPSARPGFPTGREPDR